MPSQRVFALLSQAGVNALRSGGHNACQRIQCTLNGQAIKEESLTFTWEPTLPSSTCPLPQFQHIL